MPEGTSEILARAEVAGSMLRRLVFRRLPVLPPSRRPIFLMSQGNFATSDLNDLYRRIINRNNRLRKLIELNAPEVILRNESRELQRSVDSLLDNEQMANPVLGSLNRPLVSLANFLTRAAQRQRPLLDGLLRRPVDFSARTRIVAENTGEIDTAFIPLRIARALFEFLLIQHLKGTGQADTIKSGRKLLDKGPEEVRPAYEWLASHVLLLVALETGPWRLFALRPHLGSDLALMLHPDLLDRIGWECLGKEVHLFAVLGEESRQEAEQLLPSHLQARPQPDVAAMSEAKRNSPFMLMRESIPMELAIRALANRRFPLGVHDLLVLGAREAVQADTGNPVRDSPDEQT
jgi:DNA-directed RNA polymerase subunit beta'